MKRVNVSLKRRLIPVACFIALSCACFAQDVIVTKDSKKIDAKVTEINVDDVKYKRFDHLDGPTYSLPKSEIVTIIYQNGLVETFATEKPAQTTQTTVQTTPTNVQTAPVVTKTTGNNNAAAQNRVTERSYTSENVVVANKPASVSKTQPNYKGYVGLNVGPAFVTGDLGGLEDLFESTGLGVSISFGYLFTPHVGIHSAIFGTQFSAKVSSSISLGLSGLLVGPLFSTATENGKVEFDFRPTIGFAQGSLTINDQTATTKASTFAFGVGGSLRWNCWNRVSLAANLDYYNGKPKDDDSIEMDLSSFGFSFGVNFRFGK